MAVTSVSGPRDRPADWELGGSRAYALTYRVTTDDPNDSGITVLAFAGIPQVGSTYACGDDLDGRAYCVHTHAQPISGGDAWEPKLWDVSCDFRTLPREEQKRLVHPLSRPYEISYSFEHFQTVVERDIDGDGILNSAGQYFDPPIERDDSRPVLTITRNEATFPVLLMLAYQDAINSDVWFGCPVRTVKVFNISGQRVIEEFGPPNSATEIEFYRVTYEFHFNRHTWTRQILDQGRYEFFAPLTEPQPIKDNEGQHLNDPALLDGTGHKVADPSPTTAVYLPFKIYKELPFAAFAFV